MDNEGSGIVYIDSQLRPPVAPNPHTPPYRNLKENHMIGMVDGMVVPITWLFVSKLNKVWYYISTEGGGQGGNWTTLPSPYDSLFLRLMCNNQLLS